MNISEQVSEEEKQHLREYLGKYHYMIEFKEDIEYQEVTWSKDTYKFTELGYINLTQCGLKQLRLIGLLCPQLDSLEISGGFLGDEGALIIAKMLRNMGSIYLWETCIGDFGLSRLVKNIPDLTITVLDDNLITNKGALKLCLLSEGKQFQLDHNLTDNAAGDYLSKRFPKGRICMWHNKMSREFGEICKKTCQQFASV